MNPRLRPLAVAAAALLAAGCVRRPNTAPGPARATTAAETAIYRLVAESVYVATTGRSVGVVSAPLDTACLAQPCRPLMTRWGLDPLWWAGGDTVAAVAERRDLLARLGDRPTLAGVPAGQRLLQSVAPDSAAAVAAHPDTANWTAFKEAHGGASGFVWFSPIGFSARGDRALVFVDWQCGPACGHTVTVSLDARADGGWRIADMLLLTSRERPLGAAPPAP
ncbi:MAG: hypothetical protein KGN74_13370 [Gemmatimonadota bacterium]|nr:hypothetical protein [Gemmatimonadota bacterium]